MFGSTRWEQMLQEKPMKGDPFKRMQGSDVDLTWVEEDEMAMREPIIIEKPDGLGMKMPSNDLSVGDVAELIGRDTSVEVIGMWSSLITPKMFPMSILHRCRDTVYVTRVDAAKVGGIHGA